MSQADVSSNERLDAYYRQYVVDRERLFNTSRALTVNEMATTLAHELNQPIGTVVNLLSGCLTHLQGRQYNSGPEAEALRKQDEEIIGALDFAIRQARFANQIISRIRDFTEARQPSMERLNICELVEESIQLLDWVLVSEAITVSMELGDESLIVACDRMLLQQVIVNLCRNAVEAMRTLDDCPRMLVVATYRSADGIHIDIKDTGPGVDEGTMDSLFKPFVSSKQDGMGVGLNICRSFVELHQGRLWIERNKDQGCTVHIQFPDVQTSLDYP